MIDQIHDYMQGIGPLLQLSEVLESTESPSWSLEWDDGLTVLADYDDDDQRLVLTAEVGAMPDSRQESFALLLLRYNGLWHQTGGVRLGLDDGQIVLIYDLFVGGLDMPLLSTVLENFSEMARNWVQVVENHTTSPGAVTEGGDEAMLNMLGMGIRA